MSEQAIALWRSQIPAYERIITRCCYRVLTRLTEFLPSDFQDKIQELREILSVRQPDTYENYIDVIVHHLEGKKNKSNIQLADQFVREFGGSLKYWQNVIFDVAQPIIYTNDLTVWHVRKVFDERLYIDPENLSNYRRLCALTKSYLTAITNLIKYITKFDKKKDNLAKIDDLFKKVKANEEKYVSFSQKIDIFQKSATFDELSHNISQKSKQNALKNLFHFKQPTKPTKKQNTRNTLFNYNFKMNRKQKDERVSEPTKNLRQVDKQLTNQKLVQFEKVFKNLKTKEVDVEQLRTLFKNLKLPQNTDKNYSAVNYTTIHDKDYHFSYLSHPIDLQNFGAYTKPFEKHQFVNYEINSDDEYQDLIGEDVENNTEISSVSQISRTSFVVSDGHLSDDEDLDRANKEIKPTISTGFGDRWSFSKVCQGPFLSKIGSYTIILVDNRNKYPIQIAERNEVQEALYRIVDGKDRASIMQAISKEKIKISKAKLKQFLSKKCKTVKQSNPNRTIYKIQEHEGESNEEQQQKENASCEYRPEVGDNDNQKEDPQDTGFYQNQNFSETYQIQTRRSKKQSSERLINTKVEEIGVRKTRSRKSAQESQQNKKSV